MPVPRGGQESPASQRYCHPGRGDAKKNQRLVLFADFKAFCKAVGIIHLFLIYFCVFIWSQVQKGEAIPCQVPQW